MAARPVTEVVPERVFAVLADAGDTVRWELTPAGDACVLVFTHEFHESIPAARHVTGWHLALEDLDAILGGRPAARAGYSEEVRAHYDKVLGG